MKNALLKKMALFGLCAGALVGCDAPDDAIVFDFSETTLTQSAQDSVREAVMKTRSIKEAEQEFPHYKNDYELDRIRINKEQIEAKGIKHFKHVPVIAPDGDTVILYKAIPYASHLKR